MLLARVAGRVVSTAKNDSLAGKKLLILQPIDARREDRGAKLIALDSVGAGAGETVYYCRGREASFPWYPDEVPVDATIVGIVDCVNLATELPVRKQSESAVYGDAAPGSGVRRAPGSRKHRPK